MMGGESKSEDEGGQTQDAESMEVLDKDAKVKSRKMDLQRRLHRGGVTPLTVRRRSDMQGYGFTPGYARVMSNNVFSAERFSTPATAKRFPPALSPRPTKTTTHFRCHIMDFAGFLKKRLSTKLHCDYIIASTFLNFFSKRCPHQVPGDG